MQNNYRYQGKTCDCCWKGPSKANTSAVPCLYSTFITTSTVWAAANRTVTHPTPPPARVSERQYCSPEVGVAHQPPPTPAATTPVAPPAMGLFSVEEERTPSPPPGPLSEEGALRFQRLEQALKSLRSNPIALQDPDAPCFTPPPAEMATPTSIPPLATVTARKYCSPEVGVDQPSTPPLAAMHPHHAHTPPHISASLLCLI